jgi:WD40 repeat protein
VIPSVGERLTYYSALSSDNRYIAIKTETGLYVWSFDKQEYIYTEEYAEIEYPTNAIAWQPHSAVLAVGLEDNLKLINVETSEIILDSNEFRDQIVDIVWKSNGEEFAVVDENTSIQIWNIGQRALIREIGNYNLTSIKKLDWHPTRDLLLALTTDSEIDIWNTQTSELIDDYQEYHLSGDGIGWTLDNRYFVFQSDNRSLIWDTTTGQLSAASRDLYNINQPTAWQQGGSEKFSWNASGTYLAIPSFDKIEIFEYGNNTVAFSLYPPQPGTRIYNAAWSSDGQLLASDTNNGIVIWDVTNHSVVYVNEEEFIFPSIVWDKNGYQFIANFRRGPLEIIDLVTERHLELDITDEDGYVFVMFDIFDWHASGEYIAGVSQGVSGKGVVWNAETGEILMHHDNYRGLAWHPREEWIAAATNIIGERNNFIGYAINIIDISDYSILYTLEGQTNAFTYPSSLFWSPDGSKLASVNIWGQTHIWRFDEVPVTVP